MKYAGFNIGQGILQRIAARETGVRMESLQKFADYFSMNVDTPLRGRVAEGEDFIQITRLDVEAALERSRKPIVSRNSVLSSFDAIFYALPASAR